MLGDRGRDTEGFRPLFSVTLSLSFPPSTYTFFSVSSVLFARICSPSPYNFFFLLFYTQCWLSLSLSLLLLVEGGECLLRLLLFGRAAVSYPFIFTFQSALLFPSSSQYRLHPLYFSSSILHLLPFILDS